MLRWAHLECRNLLEVTTLTLTSTRTQTLIHACNRVQRGMAHLYAVTGYGWVVVPIFQRYPIPKYDTLPYRALTNPIPDLITICRQTVHLATHLERWEPESLTKVMVMVKVQVCCYGSAYGDGQGFRASVRLFVRMMIVTIQSLLKLNSSISPRTIVDSTLVLWHPNTRLP